MNSNRTKLRARFARVTRFDVTPVVPAPFRAVADAALEQLKDRLLRQTLISADDLDLHRSLRRAANEAAAVAWLTPFPLLFLPILFEEKAAAARYQVLRQRKVRARSKELLETVA